MSEAALVICGRPVLLRDFPDEELAEVFETFAGSIVHGSTMTDGALVVQRASSVPVPGGSEPRPRHRGGSSAQKYFLDGSRYDACEQYRDIMAITEAPGVDVYCWDGAVVVVTGERVTLGCPRSAPPMLLCDIIEDWLLCASRRDGAVQVHCAAWLDDGLATLVVGSSGVGKTTELFRRLGDGSTFLSNDRAFLRLCDGGVGARSFPLPVNVGCGTIRSLGLDLPDHGLGDHDKIRLRAPEVVQRFGADYESWFPVARIIGDSPADLQANIFWDEDNCHPFWIRSWRPGPLPATDVERLTSAMAPLIARAELLR